MTSPEMKPISIAELHFHSTNPRLPEDMHGQDEATVLNWMIRNGGIADLMESIASTGYSNAEPLLTVKREQGDGYEVVEGNRRLAAIKLLNNPELADLRTKTIAAISRNAAADIPQEIPILIYAKEDEILDYLGFRHITGVKTWGPEAKARYLKLLFDRYQEKHEDKDELFSHISKIVATKPHIAKKNIATLNIVDGVREKAFWANDKLAESTIDFSVLSTAISYKNIASHIGLKTPQDWETKDLNEKNLEELLGWLFIKTVESKSRVPESRDLSSLAMVIGEPLALKAFRDGRSLDEASQYTAEAEENFTSFISKSYTWLEEARKQFKRVEQPTQTNADMLTDIFKEARSLTRNVEDMIADRD